MKGPLCLLLVTVFAAPAAAEHIPPPTEHPRLYFLAGRMDRPVGISNWEGLLTADRNDPRGTEDVIQDAHVLSLLGSSHQVLFRQADRYFGPVSGGTFRLRIDADVANPYVRFLVVSGNRIIGEYPAEQTAAGVFTGSVDLQHISDGVEELRLAIRVFTAYGTEVRFHVDGQSWFQPRDPVAARTLAEVQALAPPASQPGTFDTAWRSFRFNDAAWSVERFAGTLDPGAPTATHPFTLSADRKIVYVWVEIDTDAFVRDLARGEVRTKDLTEMVLLSLTYDGYDVATGSNNGFRTNTGSPVDAAAIDHAPPGEYAIALRLKDGSEGVPYQAYALVIEGERTLASTTVRFTPRAGGDTYAAYGNGLSSVSREPVPFLEPAAMMHVRIAHDGPLAEHQEFDLDLTDAWGDSRLLDDEGWVSHPAPRGIWTVQHGPSGDAVSASWNDVVFSVTADYLYDPIPDPEEEQDA